MNLIKIKEPMSSKNDSKILGIDFGTTNSVCSIKLTTNFNLFLMKKVKH